MVKLNHPYEPLLWKSCLFSEIDKRDSYGKTALHCSVSAGQVDTVKYLLYNHADPNIKDHREEAPLHVAVRTGNVEVVEVYFQSSRNKSE